MDPISDMLIKIKNANRAHHEAVSLPFSNMKNAIANCLVKEGFVASAEKAMKKNFPVLNLSLSYTNGAPRISDVIRVSKPSRRMYASVKEIRPVKNGKGMMVLSTPKGILSGREARKEMVGGEILFQIW